MTSKNANTAELDMSEELKRKFISGPGHIFNPTPTSHEEAVAHGNALARSGKIIQLEHQIVSMLV